MSGGLEVTGRTHWAWPETENKYYFNVSELQGLSHCEKITSHVHVKINMLCSDVKISMM